MKFFLGIDLGTSYFKAGVFDENGQLRGLGRRRVEKNSPKENRCELSVTCFEETLRICVGEAIREANVSPRAISAISYSSQANSFVLLDGADNPLTPFVLWPDERVDAPSEVLRSITERPDFPVRTGLGITPGKQSFVAKIDWFQKERPFVWEKVRSIMSISDYLVFILTGQRVSDLSTSSMTGLLDVAEDNWWLDAIEITGIERKQLSVPVKTGTLVGVLSKRGSELMGLRRNAIVFAGGLDHHVVAIGAGLPCRNYTSESTGTVLACVGYRKGYSPERGLNVAKGIDEGDYFQMAFDNNGAVALEWYQKHYAPDCATITELLEKAGRVGIGSDGLLARPMSNKFAGLTGFENIRKGHETAHFARAIMESTAASLSDLYKRLDKENKSEAVVASGGGAGSLLWLQIKANLLNKTFLMPESGELACKGAAMLCAVGASCFGSLEEAIGRQVRFRCSVFPNPADAISYKEWYDTIKTIK